MCGIQREAKKNKNPAECCNLRSLSDKFRISNTILSFVMLNDVRRLPLQDVEVYGDLILNFYATPTYLWWYNKAENFV